MSCPAVEQAKPEFAIRYYPGPIEQAPRLVLLHGWGVHGELWGDFVTRLQQIAHVYAVDLPGYGDNAGMVSDFQLETVIELLAQSLPERAVYIGWSFGGMLAVVFAEQYPERVQGLVLLASTPSFVARDGWPDAMPGKTLASFQRGLLDDEDVTLKRFQILMAHGSSNPRELLSQVRSKMLKREMAVSAVLRDNLDLFASMDLRKTLDRIQQPILWIFGAKDALVSSKQSLSLGKLSLQKLSQQSEVETCRKVCVIDQASHLLFMSHGAQCANEITHFLREREFLSTVDSHIAKEEIARSFSWAACRYDEAAILQRRVGHKLLDILPTLENVVNPVDLGCGTGYFSAQLMQRFPGIPLIGLDLAEGMLKFSCSRYKTLQGVVGDAEYLPLRESASSLVFSNLAIQWSEKPALIFAEVARILQDEGLFLFSSLLQGSLHELREAWSVVDDYTHVNRFISLDELKASIHESGLEIVSLEVKTETMYYGTLRELTNELKDLGAHNLNLGRPKGLTGRKRIAALKTAYEQFRDGQQRLPATYQVVLGVLRKTT